MSSLTASIDISAYGKLCLHCAKYPPFPVLGLLMGSFIDNKITVHNVLPVLHSAPVGPTLDIAVSSANTLYDGLKVVGIYFANERVDSDTWPHYVNKIIKGLQASMGSCLALQVKNSQLESVDTLCINGTQSGQSVKIEMSGGHTAVYVNKMVDHLLAENLHRTFEDFEDHMDSAHVSETDFRNVAVDEEIRSYVVNHADR
mmetsp:Transcript_5024/g.7677  ORF Transcript_5024/g.7677 Transcript_5024/m.7677 type:complete len:201 (-) Transcript_5024:111-713(-)